MTGFVTKRSHQSQVPNGWGRHRQDGDSGSEQPPSRHDSSVFALSSWPLRRKVALAVAIPLILAATLGGLRAAGTSRRQPTRPRAPSRSRCCGPRSTTSPRPRERWWRHRPPARAETGEVKAAVADLEAAATELEATRETADLTAEQSRQVDAMLDLSRVLREESSTLSPGTWMAQLRQLQTGCQPADHHDRQRPARARAAPRAARADARRPVLARHAAGPGRHRAARATPARWSCSPSSASRARPSTGSPATSARPSLPSTDLLTDNARRTRTVRTGGDRPRSRRAPSTATTAWSPPCSSGVDTSSRPRPTPPAPQRAVQRRPHRRRPARRDPPGAPRLPPAAQPDPQGARGRAGNVAHEQLPDAVARIRAGEEPGADHADRRHARTRRSASSRAPSTTCTARR